MKDIPVVFTKTHHYAGAGGEHVLGFTIPGDVIVINEGVIEGQQYWLRMRRDKLCQEVLEHERAHNDDPYRSEAANRAAVAYARMKRGEPVSELHRRYVV